MSDPSGGGRCVHVVAATIDETRHVIEVAQTLATGERCELTVIVSPPERMTVSSGRANVYDLRADDLDPYRRATVQGVRELASTLAPHADVVVTPSSSGPLVRGLAA